MRSCRKSNKLNGNGNGMEDVWAEEEEDERAPGNGMRIRVGCRTHWGTRIEIGSCSRRRELFRVDLHFKWPLRPVGAEICIGKRLLSPVSLLYVSLSSADIFPSILSRFSRLQQVPDGQISECIYSKTSIYI